MLQLANVVRVGKFNYVSCLQSSQISSKMIYWKQRNATQWKAPVCEALSPVIIVESTAFHRSMQCVQISRVPAKTSGYFLMNSKSSLADQIINIRAFRGNFFSCRHLLLLNPNPQTSFTSFSSLPILQHTFFSPCVIIL